jgi:hypothetical protein
MSSAFSTRRSQRRRNRLKPRKSRRPRAPRTAGSVATVHAEKGKTVESNAALVTLA